MMAGVTALGSLQARRSAAAKGVGVAASALLLSCQAPAPADANATQTAAADIPAPAAPSAGDPKVDGLLAAIAASDEASVRKLVGDVGYIVATSGIVSSEDAFVDRILGCRTESVEQVRAAANYRVVWNCPSSGGGEAAYYNAAIATDPPFGDAREGVAILEFTAGRTNPYLGKGVSPPPPTAGRKSGG